MREMIGKEVGGIVAWVFDQVCVFYYLLFIFILSLNGCVIVFCWQILSRKTVHIRLMAKRAPIFLNSQDLYGPQINFDR